MITRQPPPTKWFIAETARGRRLKVVFIVDKDGDADEDFVKVAEDIDIGDLQKSLKLQMISIRLQESLIDDLKNIAELNGIGYQPLMKQILTRFVDVEKKSGKIC